MRSSIFLFVLVLASCSTQHYIDKANGGSTGARAAAIKKAGKNHDYVTLQSGLSYYHVTFAEIDKSKKNVTVTLDRIDSSYYNQLRTKTTQKDLRSSKVLSPHMHVILVDTSNYTYDEPHTIPLINIRSLQKL